MSSDNPLIFEFQICEKTEQNKTRINIQKELMAHYRDKLEENFGEDGI